MHSHGDRRGQIADFRDSFERIKWLCIHSKCGIKTKTHFVWLLWHWSSLGQLNLEPTRPNGLMGCKVPTDLVKISAKEATHISFYYISHKISLMYTMKHNFITLLLYLCLVSFCKRYNFPWIHANKSQFLHKHYVSHTIQWNNLEGYGQVNNIPQHNRTQQTWTICKIVPHIIEHDVAGFVINYGISNTIVL